MPISKTATSTWSMKTLKTTILALVAVLAVAIYLFGPPTFPRLKNAAIQACNEHAGGNYRSYRLSWHVGVGPHWSCWDASKPTHPPVDMGWWVSPLR
ncbi:MAG: hypothetical protein ACXVXB_13175 [Nocardioidaceae bacterium]